MDHAMNQNAALDADGEEQAEARRQACHKTARALATRFWSAAMQGAERTRIHEDALAAWRAAVDEKLRERGLPDGLAGYLEAVTEVLATKPKSLIQRVHVLSQSEADAFWARAAAWK